MLDISRSNLSALNAYNVIAVWVQSLLLSSIEYSPLPAEVIFPMRGKCRLKTAHSLPSKVSYFESISAHLPSFSDKKHSTSSGSGLSPQKSGFQSVPIWRYN